MSTTTDSATLQGLYQAIDTVDQQLTHLSERISDIAVAQQTAQAESWMKMFFAALAAAMLAFFFKVAYEFFQRNFRRGPEARLFTAEMKEMYRHFNTNRGVLKKLAASIPGSATSARLSPLHFEKLKAPVDGIFFDTDSLRLLTEPQMKVALYARVKIRNRNTEAQRVIDYLIDGRYDESTLAAYVRELTFQHNRLEDWLADEILGLDRSWDPRKDKDEEVDADERAARDILRERVDLPPKLRSKGRRNSSIELELEQPDVHTEPLADPLYPKIEAVDLHKLADLVSERMNKPSKPAETGT